MKKIRIRQRPTRGKAMLVLRIERTDGTVKEVRVPNSRTDAGALWTHNRLTGLGTAGDGVFVALSRNAQNIVKTLNALDSEHTSSGLAREAAVPQNYVIPAALDGAASYQLNREIVYTGIASDVISSVGVFDAIAGGSLIWVFNVSPSEIINLNDRVILLVVINI